MESSVIGSKRLTPTVVKIGLFVSVVEIIRNLS